MNIFWNHEPGDICHHFSHKSMVTISEQNIICSKTDLDGPIHRQLFAGRMVGSQPKKKKKKMH